MRQRRQTVLLLGGDRDTLAFAREIAPQGYDIMVTRGGGDNLGRYSRFVGRTWAEPDPDADPAGALAKLAALLNLYPEIGTVVPISRKWLRAVVAGIDALPATRTYVTPQAEVIKACVDKPAMLARASSLGIPVPRSMTVTDHAALALALDEFTSPVILLPLDSEQPLLGRRAVMVPDRGSLGTVMPQWPDGHQGLMLQQLVPGRRHNLYFAAANGSLVRALETDTLRTERPGGSGLPVRGKTVPLDPRLVRAAGDLVHDLAYHGIGCIHFVVDEATDTYHLVDVEPHVTGQHAIPAAARLDLGELALALARRYPIEKECRTVAPGLHFSWTCGALRGIVARLREGEIDRGTAFRALGRIAAGAWRSKTHLTWRWDDPLPAIVLGLRALNPLRWPRAKVRAERREPSLDRHTPALADGPH